jgi:hypothetical protein
MPAKIQHHYRYHEGAVPGKLSWSPWFHLFLMVTLIAAAAIVAIILVD